MMVLVSDLHLTDERTAQNVNPEAFKLFAGEVAATARKRGAKETVLVLLGDTMDLVRSDFWLRQLIPPDERPWGGDLDPRTGMNANSPAIERQFLTVLTEILASPTARQLQATLAELERTCPAFSVRYVIGNHDRVLWNFPALQTATRQAIPQISGFSSSVESEEYGIIARHGLIEAIGERQFCDLCPDRSANALSGDKGIRRFLGRGSFRLLQLQL